jgi:hypothetical protein
LLQITQPESAAILKWHFFLFFIGFTVIITESLGRARAGRPESIFLLYFSYKLSLDLKKEEYMRIYALFSKEPGSTVIKNSSRPQPPKEPPTPPTPPTKVP